MGVPLFLCSRPQDGITTLSLLCPHICDGWFFSASGRRHEFSLMCSHIGDSGFLSTDWLELCHEQVCVYFEHEAKTALATGQSEVLLDFHTRDWKFGTELGFGSRLRESESRQLGRLRLWQLAKMLPPSTRLRVVRKIVLQVLLTLKRRGTSPFMTYTGT